MNSIYRTLCFCQKIDGDYKVFYGHSIFWKLTDLDYRVSGWKRYNIQGDIYAFFTDLPSCEVDKLLKNKILKIDVNSKKHSLIFDWEQSDTDFLINDASEDGYKPFISLCSKAIYYFSNIEGEFIDNFFREKKEAISRLEDEYVVPLTKNPHLLNTFAIYTPIRIEASLRNTRLDGNHKTRVTFYINDVFNEYQNCEAIFLLRNEKEQEVGRFKISDEPKNISIKFEPDYMELTIKDGEEVIFEEKSYFIKSVNIKMDVALGGIKTSSGTVQTHSSSSIKTGGNSE